jgi:hypothetical protein
MDDKGFQATAIFAEDIREEKSGTITIVGVMPDNLTVASFPGAFAKMAIYVRLVIKTGTKLGDMAIKVKDPDGVVVVSSEISQELIENTYIKAKRDSNPIATIYSQITASPFPIAKKGRFFVVLESKDVTEIIGSLRIVAADSTSASQPPSEQSRPDAPDSSSPHEPSPPRLPKEAAADLTASRSSSISPVAILPIITARPIASAGRFSPRGPLGMGCPLHTAKHIAITRLASPTIFFKLRHYPTPTT